MRYQRLLLALAVLALLDGCTSPSDEKAGGPVAPDGTRVSKALVTDGSGWSQFIWPNGQELCTQVTSQEQGSASFCGEPNLTAVPLWGVMNVGPVIFGIAHPRATSVKVFGPGRAVTTATLHQCPCGGFSDYHAAVFAADLHLGSERLPTAVSVVTYDSEGRETSSLRYVL